MGVSQDFDVLHTILSLIDSHYDTMAGPYKNSPPSPAPPPP